MILPHLPTEATGPALSLVGRWRVHPEHRRRYGDYCMEFTRAGELVYSVLSPEGINRILLIWTIEGEMLVTDQPSAPREERGQFRVEPDTLFLGDTPHLKEVAPLISDPLARAYAIASTAVSLGIYYADPVGSFVPTLLLDRRAGRQISRVVADDPKKAQEHAAFLVGSSSEPAEAWAYAYDGYATTQEGRFDAVLVDVGLASHKSTLTLAQPYTFAGKAAQRHGPIQALSSE